MKAKILIDDIINVLISNYMPYAVSVIEDRAIVSIDGLKPVHRRILYSMYSDGLLKSGRVKSAKAVGNVLKYHPHGDSSVYDAMVRLGQDDSVNLKLIDGKGNFGEHTSSELQYAHMRYTEAKLMPIIKELFTDLDKIQSLMIPNYDESALEPKLLPTKFPLVLSNISSGIAVGMSSDICGFNLKELCEATIEYIDNKDVDLLDYIEAPDFPTGGEMLYNKDEMRQIINTGKGSFKIRAKIEINEKENSLIISEIPYTTTREKIIEKIIELMKNKTFTEIIDIDDLTDIDGMKIEISYKKNTDAKFLINKLFKLTKLEDTYSCNFIVLINGKPMELGVKGILEHWIKFRMDCIRESTEYSIKSLEQKWNILKGYKKVINDIDSVINIFRFNISEEDKNQNLIDKFDLNKEQIEHLTNMSLKRINESYLEEKINELNNVEVELQRLSYLLEYDELVLNIIKQDLKEILQKYNIERKTKVIKDFEILSTEDLIESYNVKLCLTEQGYLKKIKATGYRSNLAFTLKDGDSLKMVSDGDNKGYVLLFTNKGNVFKKKINEFDDVKMTQIGTYLKNYLELDKDESIINIITTNDFSEDLIIAFKNGKLVKIPLKSYNSSRVKLTNAYSTASEIVKMFVDTQGRILLVSNLDKVVVIDSKEISETSTKSSQGVVCIKSKDDSYLKLCCTIDTIEDELIDLEYYKVKRNAIGKYLRKIDKIILKSK